MKKMKRLASLLLFIPVVASAAMQEYNVTITNNNYFVLSGLEFVPYPGKNVCQMKIEKDYVERNTTVRGKLSIAEGSACSFNWTTEGRDKGSTVLYMQTVAVGNVFSNKLCSKCEVSISGDEITIVQKDVM